ncbi:MAG: hypothetical protein ACXWJM_17525 [Ramlibacter sp.]
MRSHSPALDSINLFDAARRRAEELRGEARDRIFEAAADGARQALRSAHRLTASLARHSRLRAQSGA